MPRSPEPTRQRLIEAAESLLAARGVDNVSNADINTAAEQRNNSAIAYHFGDRTGLIEAVLRRHAEPLEAERARRLATLQERFSLRDVIEVFAGPVAELLQHESGRCYLRIQSQLLAHGGPRSDLPAYLVDPSSRPGLDRVRAAMLEADPPVQVGAAEHRTALVITLLFHGLADRAAQSDRTDDDGYVIALLGAIEAILRAPLD